MNSECKKIAYKAITKRSKIFSTRAIQKYLAQSTYGGKQAFVDLLPIKTLLFLICEKEMTRGQKHGFQELCFIQLDDLETRAKDEQLVNYIRMQRRLHDGSAIWDWEKFRQSANRLEIKLMKRFLEKKDTRHARLLLITALLFGSLKYEEEERKVFIELCEFIE